MTSSKPYLIRAIYEWIVDNNLTPYVAVDTNIPGTTVPETYIQDERIVLDISEAATSNLIISNNSLEFKARFGGISHNIYIPISAIMVIYAQENDRGMEFPPEEFEEELLEEDDDQTTITMSQKSRPKLTLITGGKNDDISIP
ncbi:Stringent starvation protein B homolog [Gammaproteobacteria bacterium]